MALHTVRVPETLEGLFRQIEGVVSTYFRQRQDSPADGTIEIFGERYLLLRAASLSVEFFGVVRDLFGPDREAEADDFARNILFDLAHAIGKSDAKKFHSKMNLKDPLSRIAAGPVHFAYSGWASVHLLVEPRPEDGEDFFLLYDHPTSFECDAWVQSGERPAFPACIMSAGYSSGWCEESLGMKAVASEIQCRAQGDKACRFALAHPDHIERRIAEYLSVNPEARRIPTRHVVVDLFARKRLEDELRRARDDLEIRVEQRTRELREANERLLREMEERKEVELRLARSQKLEALGRLTGGIAHDFNNLLMVMEGCSGLILDELETGHPAVPLAQDIAAASARATKLTRQLMVFSSQKVVDQQVIDLNDVVESLTKMLRRLIGEDVELDTQFLPEPIWVRADVSQMEQVVVNLAVNARDAMKHGGKLRISISLERTEDHPSIPPGLDETGEVAVLSVADTGIGMDDETLAHIFDPFYSTKAPGEGSGLGLSTVYGIVRQSRGSIRVESSPGEGATFWIRLPCVVEAEPQTVELMRRGAFAVAGNKSVLIVEDEPALRRLMEGLFLRKGYQVYVADAPSNAFGLFERHGATLDIVISDVIMPGMSGPAFIEKLRETRPDLPALFISGYTDDRVDPRSLDSKNTGFLQKPFGLTMLDLRVAELLQSKPQG